ncbi:MAG: hypothetical protein NC177_05625 [Ruminococcus flavefaciens]|nr:hypothetical protein [Ruminococcus flavefaciens]
MGSPKIKQLCLENIDKNTASAIVYRVRGKSRAINDIDYDCEKLLPNSAMKIFYQNVTDDTFDTEVFEGKEAVLAKINELTEQDIIRAVEAKTTATFPKIEYCDITENLLLNYEPIRMQNLCDSKAGLWTNMGKRKILVLIERTFCPEKEKKVRIVFNKADSMNLPEDLCSEGYVIVNSRNQAIVEFNTDAISAVFSGEFQNKKYLTLSGYIEVLSDMTSSIEKIIQSEIKIAFINTEYDVCDRIDRHIVSVDFGTSSSCVAYINDDGQKELKSLCEVESVDGENIFENPTNIMVYDWKSVYREWIEDTNNVPAIVKGSFQSHLRNANTGEGLKSDFDFGYTVKEVLAGEEPAEKRQLDSIQTLLKMTPYQIEIEKEEPQVIPYDKTDEYVYIVDDPKKQNENHFDPVAFYGYLIGRCVNNVVEGKIHINFRITSPVKFNEEIKQLISNSLKYGIQRSVPKTLRDKVDVKMENAEPVAYIGAICGTDYLPVEYDQKTLFAVYDFGGGTLDFSFGELTMDEEYDVPAITIKRTNGFDDAGGERIIEKVSYKIYCENINLMIENDIPIKIPFGEKVPAELPSRLNSRSSDAKANLNVISERISRKIFEGKSYNEQDKVTMYSCNGTAIDDIRFSVDRDDIEGYIDNIIKEKIEIFSQEMDIAFKNTPYYNKSEVYIFRAGNSSRSKIVRESMEKKFKENFTNNRIQLVDQIEDQTETNPRYAVTPKTAVALGQLCLSDMQVYGDEAKFKYFIGFTSANKFKEIEVDPESSEWVKFRKILKNETDIEFREVKTKNEKPLLISTPDARGYTIFIRIKNEHTIEYCIVNGDSVSENPEIHTIDVKTGEFDADLRN